MGFFCNVLRTLSVILTSPGIYSDVAIAKITSRDVDI